jgi:prolyl-tRNA synthetase
MRYSKLFGKTKNQTPHDENSVNAKLLLQAGFIDKVSAGIYNFLPLGLRVLKNINEIIRQEMNAVDGQEILMPCLHPIELWTTTGRDKTMDEILYRTKAGDKEFVLGPSHEETVTPLAQRFTVSYKDLPFSIYQIQTKFRNEPRAKSGLLRGREFGMKDMYSFHTSEKDLDQYYDRVKDAYLRVYKRCGLTAYPMAASGGAFTQNLSHEFGIKTAAGEDTMIVCKECNVAQNAEIVDEKNKSKCTKCGSDLIEEKAVEAGNIFKLGTKYSESFNMKFVDENGKENYVIMGCYGIGTTRLVGTIVEASHDERGIVWPKTVTPYQVHMISIGANEDVIKESENLYKELIDSGIEVLYDDRSESPGKKFNDADLIGIPLRVIVSEKTLKEKSVEFKERTGKEARLITIKDAKQEILNFYK